MRDFLHGLKLRVLGFQDSQDYPFPTNLFNMLVVYLLLLVLLLVLFILLTAIGLTFKLKVLSLEEKKEFKGLFTVKWLLFSHTFSVEEPGEKESFLEEAENSKKDGTIKEKQSEISLEETSKIQVTTESQSKAEVTTEAQTKTEVTTESQSKAEVKRERKIEEKKAEEKKIETRENKEKRGIIARIRGRKKPETKETPKAGMTTREKLHWGLEAFKSLRKPLFRLFSDLLNGIKIKRVKSYIAFGLSDPADTGMLCGYIHAITGLVYSRCKHCSFSINPVFMNTMIDFRGDMEIRVRIYSLIFPMLKFMFNWKTLSFTYLIIKEKLWGKRKTLASKLT